jgi:molybdenum cofactor cytidylyltransferase
MPDRDSIGTLWGVVLAAGESRRLGRPKQLVRTGGETLVARSVRLAQAVCGPRQVLIVLGAHRREVELALGALAPRVVVNAHWRDGLASSLRAGIEALPAGCAAALLLACDQPRVPEVALRALAQRWRARPERAVAAAYDGTVGIPAILPARLFPGLAALAGDRGAHAILVAEQERLERLPLPEAGFDVDDETALRALADARATRRTARAPAQGEAKRGRTPKRPPPGA